MSNEIYEILHKNKDLLEQFRIGAFDSTLQVELDRYTELSTLSPLMITMGNYVLRELSNDEDSMPRLAKNSILYSVGFYFSMFCILPFEFGIDDERQLKALLTLAGAIVGKVLRILKPKAMGITGQMWPKLRDAPPQTIQYFDTTLSLFWNLKEKLSVPSVLNDFVPGTLIQDPPGTARFTMLAASFTNFVGMDRSSGIILEGLAKVTNGNRSSSDLLNDNKEILSTIEDVYGEWSEK